MNAGVPELVVGGIVLLLAIAGISIALTKIRNVPLRVFIFVVALAAAGVTALVRLNAPDAGAPGAAGFAAAIGLDRLRLAFATPQVLVDEDVAVGASGWHVRGLTLSEPHSIQVVADGKAHADKGFSVYVMSASEFDDKFLKKKPVVALPSFEGIKVKSFAHTETLPSGTWDVVIQNPESGPGTMTVHVKIVSDPN
jgi:hypothetical protein